jgi:hypothetical protein
MRLLVKVKLSFAHGRSDGQKALQAYCVDGFVGVSTVGES